MKTDSTTHSLHFPFEGSFGEGWVAYSHSIPHLFSDANFSLLANFPFSHYAAYPFPCNVKGLAAFFILSTVLPLIACTISRLLTNSTLMVELAEEEEDEKDTLAVLLTMTAISH